MGRFLFVVPPLREHVLPTVSVAPELTARSHRVAWAGPPDVVEGALPDDALLLPVDMAVPRPVRRALALRPLHDDQPVVAQQVVQADAGVRLRLGRMHAPGLRRALDAALFDPRLRAGAAKVRDSLARAGGPRRAADRIEGLVGTKALTAATLPAQARESA